MAAAVLASEVLLMALFSLIQWHHFAYLVVSIALLGFGASGSALVFLAPRIRQHFRGFAVSQACLFAMSLIAGFLLAQRLSFNPEELVWDHRHWLRLGLVILLLTLPFFFAANLIGMALICYRERLPRVYAADLLGAGTGALAIIGLLFLMPAAQALWWVAGLGLAAAAAAWIEGGGRALPALAILLLTLLLAHWLPEEWSEPRVSPYKELSQLLQVPETSIVAQRSSPLGRVSVVQSPRQPIRHAPGLSLAARAGPPPQLGLFANAGGLGAITRFRGDRDELAYLDGMTSALPYHLTKPGRVLVLGAGGGDGVLQAIHHGAGRIDAVEIDPQVVELVREGFAEFSGGIYSRPDVRVTIGDARGYLQQGIGGYDIIQVPPLDSWAGAAGGMHGLNENFLYTGEALRQSIERLAPDGYLALTRWIRLPPRDTPRLFATAIAALESMGVREPGNHLLLVRGLQTSTLLVRNGEVTAEAVERLKAFCRERAFDLAWYPGMTAEEANRVNRLDAPYFYNAVAALLGSGRDEFLRDYKFNLYPATDNRPYYFQFVRWSSLGEILSLRHHGGSALIDTGYLTLLVTLALALTLGFALILLPLLFVRTRESAAPETVSPARVLAYFTALGLGFLLLEIAYLQRFILLLQHPLYAAAVVLASFLVSAGLGSAWAQRHAGRKGARRACAMAVAAIVLLGGAGILLFGPLVEWTGAWPPAARVGLAVLLIGPIGFCMGLPFPLGLAAIRNGPAALTPWAWGINGCASVVSAVLASLLAIHFGFDFVILVAMACYIVAACSFPGKYCLRPGRGKIADTT